MNPAGMSVMKWLRPDEDHLGGRVLNRAVREGHQERGDQSQGLEYRPYFHTASSTSASPGSCSRSSARTNG